ncbi:MAG: hypothetical protein ACI88A_000101 [Paraglaciecola sp.]|jgi:hypothetical protein
MINRTGPYPVSLLRQRGAMILLSVVLLMMLISLVTLYTGRIKSFEYKVMLNGQNHVSAFAAAETGLMRSLAILVEDKDWEGNLLNETLEDATTYAASGQTQIINRSSTTMNLVALSSTGTSADGLSQVTLSEQALNYPLLINLPDAAVVVTGGLDPSGDFVLGTNPNGLGEGIPLSIWSNGEVDMNVSSGSTCGQQEFYAGNCQTLPYSQNGFEDADILDNDPDFPDDLMEYLFNVPQAQWNFLQSEAQANLTDCALLQSDAVGLIWIDGNCIINSGVQIGSINSPVILVTVDGDVTLHSGVTLNGILFSFRKPDMGDDFEVHMLGDALVNGAIVSNHPLGHANGALNAVYNAAILEQLQQHKTFRRVARIPGSWKDFNNEL